MPFSPAPTTDSIWAGTVSLRDRKHKAAIALNNTAVSLLSRGYYREALDTFKDSMQLIRSAANDRHKRCDADSQPSTEEISAEDIRSILDRTWKRAAQCRNTASQDDSANRPFLQVVSSQGSPESIYVALTTDSRGHSPYVASPMTIDPIDFEDWDDNNEVNFQAGAIIYNYAIAYDCVAETAAGYDDNDSPKMQLQENTYRLFHMANSLLETLSQRVDEEEATVTCFATRFVLLRTFVTHALIQACSKRDNLQLEHQEHCENLEPLLYMMEFHQRMLWMADQHVAAAA